MSAKLPWVEDVFREKSLWHVYRASRVIPPNGFNRKVMALGCAIATFYVAGNAWGGVSNLRVLDAITRSSQSLLTIATAILGFLVTGFSIFVASTNPKIFRLLENTRYRDTEISQFKNVMFNFLNVFSVYLVALTVSVAIYVITPLGWWPPFEYLAKRSIKLVPVFNSAVLSIICLMALYSILRLKSFIWALYQSLIISMKLQ